MEKPLLVGVADESGLSSLLGLISLESAWIQVNVVDVGGGCSPASWEKQLRKTNVINVMDLELEVVVPKFCPETMTP